MFEAKKERLHIYFAGELFNHNHLTGNAILAEYLYKRSEGLYQPLLPQEQEFPSERAEKIRNIDLKNLFSCELALFNFDGSDLDSGTVVEFIFAKMLDIPSVILRSDFRASGDQGGNGDAWNLMCSFYPRTKSVVFNAMRWYQEAMDSSEKNKKRFDHVVFYSRLADKLIKAFDEVKKEQSVFNGDRKKISAIYEWATEFPGKSLKELCGENAFIERVINNKIEHGIY